MTDTQVNIVKSQEDVVIVEKKVIIKECIVKGKKKTHVMGLNTVDGLETLKDITKFTKEMKTSFGCGCQIVTEEGKQNLILQGNHRAKTILYLKTKYPNIKIV